MNLIVPKYKYLFKGIMPILLVYLYLFQPPLLISKYVYIALEFVLLMCFVIFKDKKLINNFIKSFKSEVFLLFLIISYSLVRDLFFGEEVYSLRFVAWAFQAFLFGFLIIKFFNYNFEKLFSAFYWASVIAACFSLILALNPSLDLLYKSINIETVDIYENMEVRHRAYGVSENLTFTYSYVLGFFAGYTLLILRKNRLLLIPFFLLVLGVTYNARIGFLPVFLFLFYMSLKMDFKSFLNIFVLLILAFLLVTNLYPELIDRLLFNKSWTLEFFYDISDTFFGTNYSTTSTLDTLFGRFIILPDTWFSWVFGTGISLFGRQGMNSDVGYIIQLYYGGLMLMFLIFNLLVYIFIRLIKIIGFKHWFVVVFISSILFLNFKGFIFAATPGGRMLFLFYMFFVLSSSKKYIRNKTCYT